MVKAAFVIIGEVLLNCCSGERRVEIPEGVRKIGTGAFSGCENMEQVVLPQSLHAINKFAFLNCENLKSITLPPKLRRIEKGAFKGCKGLADENGLVIVNHMVHDYCGEKTDVVIPKEVTTIGYEAFFRNKRIQSVTLHRGVEFIAPSAFDGCDNLVLRVYPGSAGEIYARSKGIPFAVIKEKEKKL